MGIARAASAAFHIVFKGRIVLRGVRRSAARPLRRARPRFVWSTTPVALMTGRSGAFPPGGRRRRQGRRAPRSPVSPALPGKDALPQRVERWRTAAVTAAAEASGQSACTGASSSSTFGIRRSRDFVHCFALLLIPRRPSRSRRSSQNRSWPRPDTRPRRSRR